MKFTYSTLSADHKSLSQMREVNRLFAKVFEDEKSYLHHPPEDAYLLRFLADPHHLVCVAIIHEQVVGALVAYVLEKFEQERSEVYIYDLAVLESHRRQGVATGLIRHLQEVSPKSAWVSFVQADPIDVPAVRLYDSLGLREEVYHYDLDKEKVLE